MNVGDVLGAVYGGVKEAGLGNERSSTIDSDFKSLSWSHGEL